MALPLERIEGKYEIISKIREGGMGAIYRVRHRLLDEVRVIKVLRSQADEPEALRARFAEEARAAIKLRHPNVVQIFDFTLDDDGVGLIVMEHIEGVDLGQLIARRTVPTLALTLEIARQALRALGYLHHRGFVHRDVSPDNLMLTRDVEGRPLVKLIDLGIAKHSERALELTSKGMFLGKFRYASPEHFGEGGDAIEPRSDLYAFGIVLYELLTGERPVLGDDASALIAGHLFRPARSFSQTDPDGRVPRMLRDIVQRAIEKRPSERFRDAAAFAEVLASVQQHYPLTARVSGELDCLTEPVADSQPAPPPGSTQHRLDAEFGLSRTPATSTAASRTAETTGSRGPTPMAIDSAFERHLAAGCQRASEGHHHDAIASFRQALLLQTENTTVRRLLEASMAHVEDCRQDWRDQLTSHFIGFERALEADDLPEAETQLGKARLLVEAPPEHAKATGADEETAEAKTRFVAASAALIDAQERSAKLATATEAVQLLIAEDRLIEADVALFQAVEVLGASGALTALRQQLDTVHHQKSDVQIQSLIARAEAAAKAGDHGQAMDLLQRAEAAAAEGPLAATVVSLRERMQDNANAHHRRQAIVEAERTILRAIQERKLDQAEKILGAAESRFGLVEPFDALRKILERTATEDHDAERVNRLLRDAKKHLAASRFDPAITCLNKAQALAPDDAWIRDRLAEAIAHRDRQATDDEAADHPTADDEA